MNRMWRSQTGTDVSISLLRGKHIQLRLVGDVVERSERRFMAGMIA